LDYEGSWPPPAALALRLPARARGAGPSARAPRRGAAHGVAGAAPPGAASTTEANLARLVSDGLSTLLRLASRVICLIVIVSFALFAIEQTSSASTHQQNELNEGAPAASRTTATEKPKTKSAVHRTIDEVSSSLTSPFSGVTAGWKNQWAIHGVDLVLALLLYGFALGFLARFMRVRV